MSHKTILSSLSYNLNQVMKLSSSTACITKIHRATFARPYPTVLVLADGSSINIKYHEPRKIIKLPLDLNKLSDSEKKERLEKRKVKKQIKIIEDVDDSFSSSKYLKFIKK